MIYTAAFDAHGRLRAAIVAMKTGTKQGQQAQELALIIHNGHRPREHGGQALCDGHIDAREDEFDWPCDEASKLAAVLGVDLS